MALAGLLQAWKKHTFIKSLGFNLLSYFLVCLGHVVVSCRWQARNAGVQRKLFRTIGKLVSRIYSEEGDFNDLESEEGSNNIREERPETAEDQKQAVPNGKFVYPYVPQVITSMIT